MKKIALIVLFLSFSLASKAQELTGNQLLEKAIAYHDPNGNWNDFNGNLGLVFKYPDGKEMQSKVHIDFPSHFFKVTSLRDDKEVTSSIKKGDCNFAIDTETTISEDDKKKYGLNCDRAKMMKNYYTYLYGLPMKLKDKGTILDPKVETKKFKGKEYLVLKATYKAEVGKDTWYFYFNPKTYAMEVYQFFHDESKNDGEYILLTEEETINGVKMPKNRAWYYNKDDKHLGTDVLTIK